MNWASADLAGIATDAKTTMQKLSGLVTEISHMASVMNTVNAILKPSVDESARSDSIDSALKFARSVFKVDTKTFPQTLLDHVGQSSSLKTVAPVKVPDSEDKLAKLATAASASAAAGSSTPSTGLKKMKI